MVILPIPHPCPDPSLQAMMERGVGKIEVSFRDDHAITRTLHLDPDQTMESVLDLLRELTGFSVETQVPE